MAMRFFMTHKSKVYAKRQPEVREEVKSFDVIIFYTAWKFFRLDASEERIRVLVISEIDD